MNALREHGVVIYSTAVLALLFVGLAFRRRRRVHIPIMATAFALDLASVIYLQIKRSAVQTAVGQPTPLLMVHVGFAIATVVLYLVMVGTGWRLAASGLGRSRHRTAAWIFMACRLGTWATSFFTN